MRAAQYFNYFTAPDFVGAVTRVDQRGDLGCHAPELISFVPQLGAPGTSPKSTKRLEVAKISG